MHVIDNANQSHRSKQHSFSSFKNSKNKPKNKLLLRIIVTIELKTGMYSLLTNVK